MHTMLTRDAGARAPGGPPRMPDGERFARRLTVRAESYEAETHSVEAVLSSGARVRRWFGHEELEISPEAIDLSRVEAGAVPLLDSHNQWSLEAVLGRVIATRIENGELIGRLQFAESARAIEERVARGELGSISVGYTVESWRLVERTEDAEVWAATRWTLLEASFVSVPADPRAGVRSADAHPAPASEETDEMFTRSAEDQPNEAARSQSALPAAPPAAAAAPAPEALSRAAAFDLQAFAAQVGVADAEAVRAALVAPGATTETVNAAIRAAVAARQAAGNAHPPGPTVSVGRDETVTRAADLAAAMSYRMLAEAPGAPRQAEPQAGVRAVLNEGDLYLWEIAARHVGHRGRMHTVAEREEVLRRAMHTTSDFPMVLESALNLSLEQVYAAMTPTYRLISAQQTYADFRPHTSLRIGDFPRLQPINEAGEIKAGTIGEARERTAVAPFGVQFTLSRQMLVNDRLGAFGQVLAAQGRSVALWEDERAWAVILSASGAGPTLLETGRAMFNVTDETLAAAGTAIDTTNIGVMRAMMLRKRGLPAKAGEQGFLLNVAPRFLLTGPDRSTVARQVLNTITVPNAPSAVNVFSGELQPIETPHITGAAWYLFADPAVGANFVWGLLDGYTAPRFRTDEPFGVQGVGYSLEHDWAFGPKDMRFAIRNPGA